MFSYLYKKILCQRAWWIFTVLMKSTETKSKCDHCFNEMITANYNYIGILGLWGSMDKADNTMML